MFYSLSKEFLPGTQKPDNWKLNTFSMSKHPPLFIISPFSHNFSGVSPVFHANKTFLPHKHRKIPFLNPDFFLNFPLTCSDNVRIIRKGTGEKSRPKEKSVARSGAARPWEKQD
jgi:hypothetical protein